MRPFYQLIDQDAVEITALCQENLNRLITETNQKNGY